MIYGLKTKDEAKAEAKVRQDIAADPTLNKLPGVIQAIADFQQTNQMASFMTANFRVPTSVKNYLEGNTWKYIVTSSPSQPPVNWNGYATTWVVITKIDWS